MINVTIQLLTLDQIKVEVNEAGTIGDLIEALKKKEPSITSIRLMISGCGLDDHTKYLSDYRIVDNSVVFEVFDRKALAK